MFKVIVFAIDHPSFLSSKYKLERLSVQTESIIWCNSSNCSRASVINENLNKWLLFLDHDCSLNQEVLAFISQLVRLPPQQTALLQDTVYAGSYKNPARASYFQKVHNFIANTWLEQAYSSAQYNKLILGGVFLIYSTQKIKNLNNFVFWGAEDKFLSYELNSLKFKITKKDELKVQHDSSASFIHFIRRAYLHGSNEVKYIKHNKNLINYHFWFRKIGFVNLDLLPLVLLHFCIQRMAGLIQRVRQQSRL